MGEGIPIEKAACNTHTTKREPLFVFGRSRFLSLFEQINLSKKPYPAYGIRFWYILSVKRR